METGRKGRQLLGLPMFSIAEGKRLGEVASLLVERTGSTVAAVGVTHSGRTHYLLYSQLRTVGEDAVLVDGEAILQQGLSAERVREFDTGLSGRPVITEAGKRLGSILGFRVDTTTGQIAAFRVRPESGMLGQFKAAVLDRGLEIPLRLVRSVGADALIVSDEADLATENEVGAAAA